MDIRNCRELRRAAGRSLASAPGNPKQVALVYGGVICLLSLISTAITFYLNSEIAGTGGLSNMGLRSILTTISAMLSYVQVFLVLGLEIGYHSAMLYASRGGTAEPRTLLFGFRRLLPMLMASIWQGIIYFGILFVTLYASSFLFTFFPSYPAFMEAAAPLIEVAYTTGDITSVPLETVYAVAELMLPMLILFAVLATAAIIPVSYQYRMAIFCIIDAERPGGLAALRESRMMMRRNRFSLFRLDLSFWWYYLLQMLIGLVAYGDTLLPMLGVALPFSDTVAYFLFLIVYLALQMLVFYFFMNRVTATYATAYEAIRPKPQAKSVALGNIFDM